MICPITNRRSVRLSHRKMTSDWWIPINRSREKEDPNNKNGTSLNKRGRSLRGGNWLLERHENKPSSKKWPWIESNGFLKRPVLGKNSRTDNPLPSTLGRSCTFRNTFFYSSCISMNTIGYDFIPFGTTFVSTVNIFKNVHIQIQKKYFSWLELQTWKRID